jgi:mRNA interferase RelE/StbE
MKLEITKQAHKFLSDLQAKQYKQIGNTILGLLKEPYPHDSAELKGAEKGERRVDVGEYRVVYSVENDTVSILVIGARNDGDVYKIWDRMK